MKKSIIVLFILLSALSVKTAAQDKPVTEICIPCEKLIGLKLPDVKITGAITVTQGQFGYLRRNIQTGIL